jgi:hypothetical protein
MLRIVSGQLRAMPKPKDTHQPENTTNWHTKKTNTPNSAQKKPPPPRQLKADLPHPKNAKNPPPT